MSYILRFYIALLLSMIIGWLWWKYPAVEELAIDTHWSSLLGIILLYGCSHVLRMVRLTLLTLDVRHKVFPLISAHTLTVFPSSFIPFKLGEILRLAAFFHVYDSRRKALAIWLVERFGDILVISIFILGLYLLKISVPPTMRTVFIIFILASSIGLLTLFAISKVFVYLNRHLVLTSLTPRSLILLRASHAIRCLEIAILKSVEGRLSGVLLLSVLIWFFEILALTISMEKLSLGDLNFAELFASGLLANLNSGVPNAFGIYQSLALVALTLIFLLVAWLITRFKFMSI